MADIHPNDIGLATYEDVGEVTKLKTAAKVVVDAINEIYQTGGGSGGEGYQEFEQIFVDGKNNVIIGQNNIVYGNNNLIIGSDNVINADNLNLIGNNSRRYKQSAINVLNIYQKSSKLEFYISSENNEILELPINVGEKVVFDISIDWVSADYMEYETTTTPLIFKEVLAVEYNENSKIGTITLEDFSESIIPPTETCNIINTMFPGAFIVLNEHSTLQCSGTSISFGGEATGLRSFATTRAKATGDNSFAANSGRAENTSAAAFGTALALGLSSFGANSAKCEGSHGAAFNSSYNDVQYSFSLGYNTRIIGRALKAVSMDGANKKITLESRQDTNGIVGKKILIRCYNAVNSYILKEGVIDALNDNVLTVSGMTFNTYNIESLFPDKYA